MDSLRAVGRPVVGGGTHPGEFRPGDRRNRRKGGGGVQAEQVKAEVRTERQEKAAEVGSNERSQVRAGGDGSSGRKAGEKESGTWTGRKEPGG